MIRRCLLWFMAASPQTSEGPSNVRHPKAAHPNRIMLLVTNLTFGGAETQVVSLAGELTAHGWSVSVVSLLEPDAYVRVLEDGGISVHSLHMSRRIPDPRAICRLRKLIRQLKPDVVHCHMFHANILGRVTRLSTPVPVVISTVHNLRETSERGGPTWYKEKLYQLTDRLADMTTIICNAAFDRYVQVGAVREHRTQVVPNFIDTSGFLRDRERRIVARNILDVGNDFVWLAVGRLVEQKDYPNLLRAVRSIGSQGMKVLIAGAGPLGPELREMTETLGLTETVRFCGTAPDMRDFYSAADAFVMPSAFEGLSVALLEASSMGLPAVVTNAGGNAEIVQERITGYVVPCGDSDALSAAMRKLMLTPESERSAMGERARSLCITHYCNDVVVKRWLSLYSDLYSHQLTAKSGHQPFPLPEVES
jgi:glycosyltransferase involved in cell wall biosynthesis